MGSPDDGGAGTLTPQRLVEIRRFHSSLISRLETDASAISGFERTMVVDIMAELIEHAEGTT